jgi:hypothetical protein
LKKFTKHHWELAKFEAPRRSMIDGLTNILVQIDTSQAPGIDCSVIISAARQTRRVTLRI